MIEEGSDNDADVMMRPVGNGKRLPVLKTGETATSSPFNAYYERRDDGERGRGEQCMAGVTTRSLNEATGNQEDDDHIIGEQPVAGVPKRSCGTEFMTDKLTGNINAAGRHESLKEPHDGGVDKEEGCHKYLTEQQTGVVACSTRRHRMPSDDTIHRESEAGTRKDIGDTNFTDAHMAAELTSDLQKVLRDLHITI